ncbi:MAG: CHAT domain-containing protein, partial [Cyanobacteriota bacterium]|nr:CHAT domain-containing protein [Cyanobacteriota bacterium]
VVHTWADRLVGAMGQWLEQPQWLPLQQTLSRCPQLPLRLRCTDPLIERLPWEALELQRPLWRLGEPAASPAALHSSGPRRPRLLLLIGQEGQLPLEADIERLADLASRGRIELRCLRHGASSLEGLRTALADPLGWDGLIFLGHSSADPLTGGRLQLGNGHWLSGDALAAELRQATGHPPSLVLLNSCSGMDLARSCLSTGTPWALCFREVVPTQAASVAFAELLSAMEPGRSLTAALAEVRHSLQARGPAGCHLLLSAMAAPEAADLSLPLSRRRQFRLRLATSRRPQAIAAALLLALSAAAELHPTNPVSTYLLDRRLYSQKLWRRLTAQPGPQTAPIPVLLLNRSRTPAELGLAPPSTTNQELTSRAVLAEVLRRTPPAQVPVVGLDVLFDRPEPHTGELAEVIQRQAQAGRAQLVVGQLEANANDPDAGALSQPQPELLAAGAIPRSLGVGIPDAQGPLKPLPLRLLWPLDGTSFAGSLSGSADPLMPAESVIDWSIDWAPLIRLVAIADLPALQARALVVGSDGSTDRSSPDRFAAPGALRPTLTLWGAANDALPGPVLQAVLAQSLALRHWLTPLSQPATTALAAGAGVVLAAAVPRRARRWPWLLGAAMITIPLSLQLAVGLRVLLPLALPLAALGSTALLRRD